MKRRSCFAIGR